MPSTLDTFLGHIPSGEIHYSSQFPTQLEMISALRQKSTASIAFVSRGKKIRNCSSSCHFSSWATLDQDSRPFKYYSLVFNIPTIFIIYIFCHKFIHKFCSKFLLQLQHLSRWFEVLIMKLWIEICKSKNTMFMNYK